MGIQVVGIQLVVGAQLVAGVQLVTRVQLVTGVRAVVDVGIVDGEVVVWEVGEAEAEVEMAEVEAVWMVDVEVVVDVVDVKIRDNLLCRVIVGGLAVRCRSYPGISAGTGRVRVRGTYSGLPS